MSYHRIITVATCVSVPVVIVLMAIQPERSAVRGVPPTTRPTSGATVDRPSTDGRAASSVPSAPPPLPRALSAAIRLVESGGNDLALGDGGKSAGPYQIQRAYWREAVAGTDAAAWSYDAHVWDRDRAEYVVWLHWEKVCPAALRQWNVELLVRCHRLPGDPWRADNTRYWRKVKAALAVKVNL